MRVSRPCGVYWIVALAVFLTLVCAQPANAVIANYIDIGGFTTFQDLNTNRVWMDMDNFFGQNTTTMVAAAATAGFSFGTKADVLQLLNSLPLTSGEWLNIYKPIMMDAPNRELIWGSYDDGGDPWGFAYAYDTDPSWSFVDNVVAGSSVPNQGSPYEDMNIWAYQVGAVIPEPSTLGLLGLGLVGLCVCRRRTWRG